MTITYEIYLSNKHDLFLVYDLKEAINAEFPDFLKNKDKI